MSPRLSEVMYLTLESLCGTVVLCSVLCRAVTCRLCRLCAPTPEPDSSSALMSPNTQNAQASQGTRLLINSKRQASCELGQAHEMRFKIIFNFTHLFHFPPVTV